MAAADVIVCLEELGKRSLVKPPGGPLRGRRRGMRALGRRKRLSNLRTSKLAASKQLPPESLARSNSSPCR